MSRSSNAQGKSIGDSVQSSPFGDASDPLLFPFLVLEAKSDKSPNGFDDISNQTAFPILALLRLQEDLARQVDDEKLDGGPLAWFFASRGDAWRVYGCYVTEENPIRYVRQDSFDIRPICCHGIPLMMSLPPMTDNDPGHFAIVGRQYTFQ